MALQAHHYRAFGIDFQSSLVLPEMRAGQTGAHAPVRIRAGASPRPVGAIEIDPGVSAGQRVFWMEVPRIVRLLVADGQDVVVEPLEQASDGAIRAYLLGSAMGALLHQRGLLPLHASAVEIDGQAVAFTGASGAGKSTMALHLNRRGHPLICDDICAVDTSGATPLVWPGLRNLKLWRETLGSVGMAPDRLEQVVPSLDKYRLPVASLTRDRPLALGRLLALETGPDNADPRIQSLAGADAAGTLIANTFRGQLVGAMAHHRLHFEQCASLARTSVIQRLTRPRQLSRIDAACALVEHALAFRT